MAWATEYTDEFERWWGSLTLAEKERVHALVVALGTGAAQLIDPSSRLERNDEAVWRIRMEESGTVYEVDYRLEPEARKIVLLGGRKSL